MATIYRKEGSPFYWMRFSYQGTRYQESTKKDNYNAAEKVMSQRVKQVKGFGGYNDLFDKLTKALADLPEEKREKARRELAARLLAGSSAKLPITEAFATYKAKPLKRSPTKATLDRQEADFKRFTDWLSAHHPETSYMHEVNPAIAEGYGSELWSLGIASRTFNRHLILLGAVFKKLKNEAGLISNPFEDVESVDLQTTGKEPLSSTQIEAIVGMATGELKTLILVGLYTGLRLGDACTLKWSEVDLVAGTITRIPSKTKKTKRSVSIPIHAVLRAVLLDLQGNAIGDSPYVLPGLASAYLHNPTLVSRRVQSLFVKAEIDTKGERHDGRGTRATTVFGFHSLRHSFVSLCHASGIPSMVVRDLVGHNSEAVNQIYQHSDNEMKQKAIASLPDVTNRNGGQ